MTRCISSLALGIAPAFIALGALAQAREGAGEQGTAGPPVGSETRAGSDADAAERAKGGGAVASAPPPDASGRVKLGLRVGYGLPMGEVAPGNDLSGTVSSVIPIWLDLGYMVTSHIMLGLYGQYGLLMRSNCPGGASCGGSDIRVGLQGQYHPSPEKALRPWFGIGVGYEVLSSTVETGGTGFKGEHRGIEFINLQAGVDIRLVTDLAAGPFVSFSVGEYSSSEITGPTGQKVEGGIEERGLHDWLVVGVKGTFDF